jgi:hypothetical protein
VQLPSTTARATGFIIALVTAFGAILMVRNGLASGGVNAVAGVAVGLALVIVAVAVAALVLIPERIARLMRRLNIGQRR